MPSAAFAITKGTPKVFGKPSDSGNRTVSLFFCGDCGTTMWSQTTAYGDVKVIKAGVLDAEESALEEAKPGLELFARNRLPWLPAVEGAQQFESSPEA